MKRLISILLSMMLMVTAVIPALSVSAAGQEEPGGEPYEVRSLTTYVYSKDNAATTDALFTKQLPTIPYLDAEDFFDHIYTPDFTTTKNPDGTFSITSKNGTMVVDTEKDALYFDAFEHFIISDPHIEGSSMQTGYATTAPPVVEGETKALTLDLGAYGIDLIEHQGKAYFPLPTLADLVCITYNSAEYTEGSWKQVLTEVAKYFEKHRDYLSNLLLHTTGYDSFVNNMVQIHYERMRFLILKVAPGNKLSEMTEMYIREYCYGTVHLTCEWILGKYKVSIDELTQVYINTLPVPLDQYLF